jgi:hypothetical protein
MVGNPNSGVQFELLTAKMMDFGNLRKRCSCTVNEDFDKVFSPLKLRILIAFILSLSDLS